MEVLSATYSNFEVFVFLKDRLYVCSFVFLNITKENEFKNQDSCYHSKIIPVQTLVYFVDTFSLGLCKYVFKYFFKNPYADLTFPAQESRPNSLS